MAGTIVADQLEAASTSTLVIKNGVASTPPTIQDSAGTQIGTFCRAWVNFNGTGTVAIRASFNVSSITDNGNGDYTVNFTTAMPDVNYAWSAIGSDIAAIRRTFAPYTSAPTTTAFRFLVTDNAINQTDAVYNAVAIFR
jgi:hypothetical protein